MQAIEDVRPHVNGKLVKMVREKYPIATGGLRNPGDIVDWALRKLLEA